MKEIVSNFLLNVFWYNGLELLFIEFLVRIVIYMIEKVVCMDIKNFIFFVSNIVKKNVFGLVELVVNCKWFFFKLN